MEALLYVKLNKRSAETQLVDGDSEASAELSLQTKLDDDAEDNYEQCAEQQQNQSNDTTNGLEQCKDDNEQLDNEFSVRGLE